MALLPSNRRRVSIDVSDKLYGELSKLFNYGERNAAFILLLEWLVEKRRTMSPTAFYAVTRTGTYDHFCNPKELADGDS